MMENTSLYYQQLSSVVRAREAALREGDNDMVRDCDRAIKYYEGLISDVPGVRTSKMELDLEASEGEKIVLRGACKKEDEAQWHDFTVTMTPSFAFGFHLRIEFTDEVTQARMEDEGITSFLNLLYHIFVTAKVTPFNG